MNVIEKTRPRRGPFPADLTGQEPGFPGNVWRQNRLDYSISMSVGQMGKGMRRTLGRFALSHSLVYTEGAQLLPSKARGTPHLQGEIFMHPSPSFNEAEDQRGLSFADGFQFGCGFFIAAFIAAILTLLLLALAAFILSLSGIGLLKDLLGGTGAPLSLPPLSW